ncbi:MAG: uracil-DNA glycosylase [Planctomycetota bacterium]|nr:uracil-DNA glycosylase [Planctomycetota bacterium]
MEDRQTDVDPRRLARFLRQRLEACRRFGWEPPVRPPRRAAAAAASRPRHPPASPVDGSRDNSPAERSRREALLEEARHEVAACRRCGLCRSRTQTVFGVGDPCARLLFVGEAPGFEEDRRGEPFVGPAGQLLDDIIRAMRLAREDVYIANIVKCRPPNNRNPAAEEVASCITYLRRQIEIISPEVLCALGSVAARTLLETTASVGALRGRFHEFQGIPLRVTYHPAYLLRNPADKRKTWQDVQSIMERLGL